MTIKRKRHACVSPPTPHPQGARRSVRHVLMKQRYITDNATGVQCRALRTEPTMARIENMQRSGVGRPRVLCAPCLLWTSRHSISTLRVLAVPGTLPSLRETLKQHPADTSNTKDSPCSSLVTLQGVASPPLPIGCGQELHGLSLHKEQRTAHDVRRARATGKGRHCHLPLVAKRPGVIANFTM